MNQQELWEKRANSEKRLDVPALEDWLWDAARVIRGPLDAPKFKDYILPLVFLKRLSDVFADEITHLAHGQARRAQELFMVNTSVIPTTSTASPC